MMPLLLIGFCTYIKSGVKDFKEILTNINEYIDKSCKENDFRSTNPHIRNSLKVAVGLHVEMLR